MPADFKDFFDDHLHWHTLVEARNEPAREEKPDDVMIRACGMGVYPSFVITRDGRKIIVDEGHIAIDSEAAGSPSNE